jgi:hypothetical protein
MAAANQALGQKRPIRILSASIDSGLNQSRALLLRHYGFDVDIGIERTCA